MIDSEKVLYQGTPSSKLIFSMGFKTLFILLILFIAFGTNIFVIAVHNNNYNIFFNILIFYLSIFVLILVYMYFLVKTYKYKITNKGIYFFGGLLTKREKFVPFFKVTNVDILQTFIDQLLGIKRLGVQTAGNGGAQIPEITFQGLKDADKPKQIILKMIEKNK